jgi:hypothetical protein
MKAVPLFPRIKQSTKCYRVNLIIIYTKKIRGMDTSGFAVMWMDIVTGDGLHVLEIIFGFPIGVGNSSVLKDTQPGSEAQTACSPTGTGNSFTGGEVAGS